MGLSEEFVEIKLSDWEYLLRFVVHKLIVAGNKSFSSFFNIFHLFFCC